MCMVPASLTPCSPSELSSNCFSSGLGYDVCSSRKSRTWYLYIVASMVFLLAIYFREGGKEGVLQ